MTVNDVSILLGEIKGTVVALNYQLTELRRDLREHINETRGSMELQEARLRELEVYRKESEVTVKALDDKVEAKIQSTRRDVRMLGLVAAGGGVSGGMIHKLLEHFF